MMKIGIVCYPTYGGSGVIATELGRGLANKGYEVHFVSYAQPIRLDLLSPNIYFHEVIVKDYPLFVYPPYIISLAGKLVDVVRYHKLNLIHVHYALPHATAAQLAQQALHYEGIDIPVITTLHGTDINLVGKDEMFEPIIRLAINQSDGVTAVSKSLKDNTHQFFNIQRDIEVIPNFVDFERFSYKPKNHFKKAIAPDNERILVHASNFRTLKRVDNVIRIFEKVNRVIPSKLLLVGDGPDRQRAEKLCRELDLCDKIRFLGKLDAVEEIFAVSDLFIMPSETESFGLAALEAMACQVPVISSNVDGLPEVNINGVTGFTSDVDNIEEMAQNAICILSDENRLQEFRENALKQAKQYDIQNILPLYEQYYKQVLESKTILG